LSFGNVTVGSSGSQTFKVTNTGIGPVTLSRTTVTGAGFAISGPSLPMTLLADQSAVFNVGFTPTAAGSVTGSASVSSTASNSPASVSLSGTGVTLLISGSPTSSSFGNVVLSESSTLIVTLTNTGTGSVTIGQATVAGSGFSISGLSLPLTLAAGQSINYGVTFAPAASGSVSGSVSIVSNATNSPTNESLSGVGIHMVTLSWQASTSMVAGYNVYRGTVSGSYAKVNSSLVNGTGYMDTFVQSGQGYYYVVTAVDYNNNESAYSNQAVAQVPNT
jgi:hypothetical protein